MSRTPKKARDVERRRTEMSTRRQNSGDGPLRSFSPFSSLLGTMIVAGRSSGAHRDTARRERCEPFHPPLHPPSTKPPNSHTKTHRPLSPSQESISAWNKFHGSHVVNQMTQVPQLTRLRCCLCAAVNDGVPGVGTVAVRGAGEARMRGARRFSTRAVVCRA